MNQEKLAVEKVIYFCFEVLRFQCLCFAVSFLALIVLKCVKAQDQNQFAEYLVGNY